MLKDINMGSNEPCGHDMEIGMRVLTAIVLELRRSELALVEIVDGLYNQDLLKETDDDRSAACQMVFVALGWISK
jgi:hypothetical protein